MTPKMEETILRELHSMRNDIIEVKITIEELTHDLQEVKPEYIKKLKKIDKGDFLSRTEFEKALCE